MRKHKILVDFKDYLVVILIPYFHQYQQQESANFWSGTILTARNKILNRELLFGKRYLKADYSVWACIAFYW
jgi:hypothetical protein